MYIYFCDYLVISKIIPEYVEFHHEAKLYLPETRKNINIKSRILFSKLSSLPFGWYTGYPYKNSENV